MTDKLPPWPEAPFLTDQYNGGHFGDGTYLWQLNNADGSGYTIGVEDNVKLLYERARADAAMARLRVACEALQEIAQGFWVDEAGTFHRLDEMGKFHHALDCVHLIGELPTDDGKGA